MKYLKSLLLFLILLPTLTCAAECPKQSLKCELSIFAVNPEDGEIGQRIISPDQVISAKLVESKILEDSIALKVTLNSAGEKENKAYTSKNIGSKLAVFCNGRELTKVTIASRSEGYFMIEGVEWPFKQ